MMDWTDDRQPSLPVRHLREMLVAFTAPPGCAGHAFSSLGLPAPRPPSRHESGCARTSWPPDGLLSCHDGAVRSRCKLAGTPRNDAGTRSMEGTGKIGISSDQKADRNDRRISVAPMM